MKEKIINALEVTNILIMPFLLTNLYREKELHRIGTELGLRCKTLWNQHSQRYGMVLMERI